MQQFKNLSPLLVQDFAAYLTATAGLIAGISAGIGTNANTSVEVTSISFLALIASTLAVFHISGQSDPTKSGTEAKREVLSNLMLPTLAFVTGLLVSETGKTVVFFLVGVLIVYSVFLGIWRWNSKEASSFRAFSSTGTVVLAEILLVCALWSIR